MMENRSSSTPTMSTSKNCEIETPKKKRGRPAKVSKNDSVCNTPNSVIVTNKFQALTTLDDDKSDNVSSCQVCKKDFHNKNDKMIECFRCRDHFCLVCVGKTVEEYEIMARSDVMWFCINCREKVEKNIMIDRKIEDACKEMALKFEERLKNIEERLSKQCSKEEIIALVREELSKNRAIEEKQVNCDKDEVLAVVKEQIDRKYNEKESTKPDAPVKNVQNVLSEISERKSREANIIVYGSVESDSNSREARIKHDLGLVTEVAKICNSEIQESDILKVIRLGKYDKNQPKRPILVKFKESETKAIFFKGIRKLNESDKFKEIKISNDLTRTERDNEKKLLERAKELRAESSGEFTFRVRGPPWARRVIKLKVGQQM